MPVVYVFPVKSFEEASALRHVFIVNPAAGKKRGALLLQPRIRAAFEGREEPYAIRPTHAPRDATRIAQEECSKGDPVRLYACGGDGTLLETAEGLAGCPHAQLAVVPCGSANDYVRSYGSEEAFLDLDAQIEGRAVPVDGVEGGGHLSLNMASMGMDAEVARKMVRYKNLPLVSGPMAYNLAIADVFFHKIGMELDITIDTPEGEIRRQGRYFFALAACGQYYGGGYRGAPQARTGDGLLDFVLIKAMPRIQVPAFLSRYKEGKHLGMACCERFRGTGLRVSSSRPVTCTMDGECFAAPSIAFAVRPAAFSFVLPRGVDGAGGLHDL